MGVEEPHQRTHVVPKSIPTINSVVMMIKMEHMSLNQATVLRAKGGRSLVCNTVPK